MITVCKKYTSKKVPLLTFDTSLNTVMRMMNRLHLNVKGFLSVKNKNLRYHVHRLGQTGDKMPSTDQFWWACTQDDLSILFLADRSDA